MVNTETANRAGIRVRDITREFKRQRRRPGLGGAVRGLIAPEYDVLTAVDHISFDIEPGEVVGYIGPNGAGKSTTIKMLVGILVPTGGEVSVGGIVPHRQRMANARNIGVVFGQRTQLWWDIPVSDTFKVMRHMYGIPLRHDGYSASPTFWRSTSSWTLRCGSSALGSACAPTSAARSRFHVSNEDRSDPDGIRSYLVELLAQVSGIETARDQLGLLPHLAQRSLARCLTWFYGPGNMTPFAGVASRSAKQQNLLISRGLAYCHDRYSSHSVRLP